MRGDLSNVGDGRLRCDAHAVQACGGQGGESGVEGLDVGDGQPRGVVRAAAAGTSAAVRVASPTTVRAPGMELKERERPLVWN